MHLIDQYAYGNRIRMLHPAQKAGLALSVVALCLILDHPLVGLLTVLWMTIVLVAIARVPAMIFARVLVAEGLFLALSVLGIAVNIGLSAPANAFGALAVGPIVASVSYGGLLDALRLVCRSLGCVAALNMLVLTTPLIDLIGLAQRLRVPALLIDVMMLMYRSIFVLFESFERMLTAQESRLGYRTPRQAMHSAGLLGSRLFLDAYQRAQRLHVGLESRGYAGELPVLPLVYRHDRRWYALMALIWISLVLVRMGWEWLF